MKARVAVFGTMSAPAFQYVSKTLKEGGCEVVTGKSFDPELRQDEYPQDEIKELVSGADVVLTAGSKAAFGPSTSPPRRASCAGSSPPSLGYNAIDVNACTERSILVSNSPVDTNYDGVLQHTILLALALRRKLSYWQQHARQGLDWTPFASPMLPELIDSDTTLGIVGFGRIGYRVARVFRLLGARVLVYDPYVHEDRCQRNRRRTRRRAGRSVAPLRISFRYTRFYRMRRGT